MRIEPVRKKRDEGEVECVAENAHGDPVSAKASLKIFDDKEIPNGFPQIIQNPGMKVVEKGRNTVLVCEAGGDPKPTITWIKDTMPVILGASDGKSPRISMLQQGKLRGSLRIEAAEESDQIFFRENMNVLQQTLLVQNTPTLLNFMSEFVEYRHISPLDLRQNMRLRMEPV